MSRGREREKTTTTAGLAADRAGFVSRLHAILRHWPSADRLARATGVSPSAFRKWLKGEAEPSRERLVALAEAASVGVGWLATGEGPEPRLQSIGKSSRTRSVGPIAEPGLDTQEFVLLPKRPTVAAAGLDVPVVPPPANAEFMALRRDWVPTALGVAPDSLHIETAVGESMQPGIANGDLLFVDTTITNFTGFGVYVIEIGGDRLVKRVQPKLDGSLTLISDNPAYETEHLPPSEAQAVRVIGRVLWRCGPLRSARGTP